MAISMYAASVPVFRQMLTGLSAILAKADAYAAAKKVDPAILLHSRLYPDMFHLLQQVQIATEFARGACARLAGIEVPKVDGDEASFADLQANINKTLSFLNSLSATQIDGSETREIVLRPGTPKEKKFTGQPYLLSYALPQFFFHVTTAYAILRHNGLEVGKKDYMGA